MKLHYYADTDSLYIDLSEKASVETREVSPGIVLDYDEAGHLCGIDAMIAEAVKTAPPPLSVEEQRKKNQAAIDLLDKWREEDTTDDPEQIAKSLVEWEEF